MTVATFDPNKLSKLDWVIVGGGGLALISLFLPWYGASAGAFSSSVSGWGTSYGWLGALLIIAAGVYVALHRSGTNLSSLRLTPAVAVLGASALGTVIVLIRSLTLPSGHVGILGVSVISYGPRVGIFLTIIAGVAQAVAAFRLFRSSGEKFPKLGGSPRT